MNQNEWQFKVHEDLRRIDRTLAAMCKELHTLNTILGGGTEDDTTNDNADGD